MKYIQERRQKIIEIFPNVHGDEWTIVDPLGDLVDRNNGNATCTFEGRETGLLIRFVRDRGFEHIDVGVRMIEEPPRFFSIELVRALAEGIISDGQDLISFAQSVRREYDRKIGDLAQKLFEEKHEISLTSLASLEFQLRALQKVVSWLNLPIQLTNFLKNEQDWLARMEIELGRLQMEQTNEVSGHRARPRNNHSFGR